MTPETELQLMQTLGRMEGKLADMDSRLFGNGQPGIIKEYDNRLDHIEKAHSSFLGVVKFLKYAATVGPLLVAATEFIIHTWLPFRQ